MPTRKITERERLTLWARQCSDDELAEATEILRIEQRARLASKAKQPTRTRSAKPAEPHKPADTNQSE